MGSDISCTSEQMLAVVNRSLVVQQFPIIEDTDEKAIGDLVSTTCKRSYICVAAIDTAFSCWVSPGPSHINNCILGLDCFGAHVMFLGV